MHPAFPQILLHLADRALAEMEDARSECRRRIRIPKHLYNVIRIPASHLRPEYQLHLTPRKMKTSTKSTAKLTMRMRKPRVSQRCFVSAIFSKCAFASSGLSG